MRGLCKHVLGVCGGTNPEDHWQLWSCEDYPKWLKALMKLPVFKGDERMADAYICGYHRGLIDARWLLTRRPGSKAKAKAGKRLKP